MVKYLTPASVPAATMSTAWSTPLEVQFRMTPPLYPAKQWASTPMPIGPCWCSPATTGAPVPSSCTRPHRRSGRIGTRGADSARHGAAALPLYGQLDSSAGTPPVALASHSKLFSALRPWQSGQHEINSCSEMFVSAPPCRTLSPSRFSATAKLQQVPNAPWFLTPVTATLPSGFCPGTRQSIEAERATGGGGAGARGGGSST